MSSLADLRKLKVAELKEELAKRDLDTKGVKEELVQRLLEATSGEAANANGDEKSDPAQQASETQEDGTAAQLTEEGQPGPPAQVDSTNPSKEPQSNGEATQRSVVPHPPQQLTEADRARKRAERFGVPVTAAATEAAKKDAKIAPSGFETDLDKLKKRAERFGLPPPTDKTEELEKKRQRAERFGLPVPVDKGAELEKIKLRAQRFQPGGAIAGTTGEVKAKLQARAERFGTVAK